MAHQQQQSSRLNRLLTLLDSGSTQATRFTTARQIGDIAKSHPQDLNSLLKKQLWNDIGEAEADKDWMLFELERECLEVYHRKVKEVANTKARLHQSVVAKEAELATLMAVLGELNIHSPVKRCC